MITMDEQIQDSQPSGGYNDLENYAEMLKPFENDAAAESAVREFFNAVREIRKKCRIADVHVIMFVPVENETRMSSFHLGNSALVEIMCASALGIAQKENNERVTALIGTQAKNRKSRKK